jgi:cytochrome c biogenesis protein CcdA/thiol-disulfide isomerase/thioredoxin
VIVLLGIGFLAGIITAISPCVFPVLPILFAGGVSGGRRRPYAIIAGLILSFALFTLFAAWVLDQLGLPKDLLRNISIGLLFLLAATLIVPRIGEWLERPFLVLTRRRSGDLGGGFLLGASLGLVFVPCAGPVLGVITTQAAQLDFGLDTVLLTSAYSLGAAVPMLAIAAGGQRAAARAKVFRSHAREVRAAMGALMALAALAITFHVDEKAQTAIGNYTSFLQSKVEETPSVRKRLAKVTGADKSALQQAIARGGENNTARLTSEKKRASLPDYGRAPEFAGISHWLNTRNGRPLTLRQLHGKVVLVDFLTYSCINCIRTFPHLKAWYSRYAKSGFLIVGVHTPEFAFEHVLSNVRRAVRRFGLRYPIALDNDYGTWNAYSNQYWPAEYLIDIRGHIRHAHFGEGEYNRTESAIRQLLGERGARLPAAGAVRDTTPQEALTPESYLGYSRIDRFAGSPIVEDRFAVYRFPVSLGQNELAYSGRWRVSSEESTAGFGARLRLHFHALKVYLVLGGQGTVEVLADGKRQKTVLVRGIDRLYTIASFPELRDGILELRFSPGVEGYAFTFG